MRDQTVGSNIREGGDALVNRSSWDRQPVDSIYFRVGSMYSQAHITLLNIRQASVAPCDQGGLKRHPWEAWRLLEIWQLNLG